MKRSFSGLTRLTLAACLALPASAATLFMGAYPDAVLVFDEAKGQVVDRIPLTTGLPNSIKLSQDRKSLYVTTNDHSGMEVIDVATHKVTNHFVLNDATHKFRFNGGAPDPEGKLLYTTTTQITKLADRYEIGKPKYTIVDLVQQKISKTVDQPTADAAGGADV